ncbi:glycerate kinase type-2 family protein [Roseospira goensis]|uniref:Hydroxypyruvate reductase n=1 Tax=Roseospira goensis TaxID=391922 RepID=A0A7W6S2D0_9PROT|nr:glycerate kinase [Roseospira goensis]MBB4287630.1 hydroxypyruvate reductase [Roseospira goensis]
MTPAHAPRALLRALFDAAVAAADPAHVVPSALPPPPRGRVVVVGAGKAAAAMAKAVEDHWPGGPQALEGLVITRHGHGAPTRAVRVVEAGHPVPDAAGRAAAAEILRRVGGLGPEDLVLCLLSGGGSALLSLPPPAVPFEDTRAVTQALLRAGAAIDEINAVRKHLSAIQGGRLAVAAAPARVVTLAISDVAGDDPAVIASGPTVADPSTRRDALAVLDRYGISAPDSVRAWLDDPACETPKPGETALAESAVHVIARPWPALEAAAAAARAAGVTPLILGDALQGEAREVARALAGMALSCAAHGQPAAPPCVLLSGGELTVTVRGSGGRGGPNAEFALALAQALNGAPGIHALACDSDGIDGSEDNAGALIGPDTLARARAAGEDVAARLAANQSWDLFDRLGDLVVTGPTRTNVNDVRAILIHPAGGSVP